MKEWLLPREQQFFDRLEEQAAIVLRGAEALHDLLHRYEGVPAKRQRVKDLEHEGDMKVHDIIEALNRTFVTPLDREDIRALASDLDNVLDMVDAAASRMDLYRLKAPSPGMVELGEKILAQMKLLRRGVGLIRDMKNADEVERIAVEVNRLENAADEILNRSVAALFESPDPVHIIKHKEILERLEEATDRCEDVADHLSDIVAKYR